MENDTVAGVGETPEELKQTADSAEKEGKSGADGIPAGEGANIAELEKLEKEIAELKDQYLRKAADFENFRKRMNREKQEAIEFANTSLLLDIIQVMDDFDRALKSAETSKDFQSFYDGVSMIEKRLCSELENKWGLKRFDSAGQVFDPSYHEALTMEKSAEVEEPMVAEDFIKGYTLKERVIRPAKVKVIMPE